MSVKVDFPGLLIEKLPSGARRYRVRVEGKKTVRVRIPVGPDDPDFLNHYWSARAGEVYVPRKEPQLVSRSLDWLTQRYLQHLEGLVKAQLASPATLKQRRSLLSRLCDMKDDDGDRYGDCDMDAPTSAFIKARNNWMAKPAEADNLVKAARSMYRWACEIEEIATNPLIGIPAIHKSRGGAKPWTADDLKRFRECHAPGTTAHLWLTLTMFTACRIGDARLLGREHEREVDGITWLRWQPGKKGSALVEIPMMPPLHRATRAAKVQGVTYLLTERGKPYGSMESLRMRVRAWCNAAGLADRSAHGVRKATAELLAEAGCSQHQIMAIMAHTQAKTSEVYTKGAQRRILAADAMRQMANLDW